MKILGIETSCDETALSLIKIDESQIDDPKFSVLKTELYSQVEKHKEYGGVFPSLAKREHARNLVPLLKKLLSSGPASFLDISIGEINPLTKEQLEILKEVFEREPELLKAFEDYIPRIKKPDIDLVAVTYGPGLEPALWVGINFARALSLIWQIPVVPTNHMEGHIVSVLKDNHIKVDFPVISLLISGGHTELILINNWGDYKILGQTQDDAVGEAFDKVARLLDLPYPGGPEISKLAEEARKLGLENQSIKLPRPMLKTDDYNFSFSGLKTAVLYLVKKLKEENHFDESVKKIIALEFENAATEVLFHKTKRAVSEFQAKRIIIGGGVIANKHIRKIFQEITVVPVSIPELELATDNATMIGIAGYLKSLREPPVVFPFIKAVGNLEFNKD